MPFLPLRPCSYPGCPTLNKHSRCEEHRPISGWKSKLNTTERGYGYAWRQLRLLALKRDNGLCQLCARQGRIKMASEVDQIRAKANQGDNQLDNLQSLCAKCHKAKTIRDRGGKIPRILAHG